MLWSQYRNYITFSFQSLIQSSLETYRQYFVRTLNELMHASAYQDIKKLLRCTFCWVSLKLNTRDNIKFPVEAVNYRNSWPTLKINFFNKIEFNYITTAFIYRIGQPFISIR